MAESVAEKEAKKQRAIWKRSFTRAEKSLQNAIDAAQTPAETIKRRFGDLRHAYEEAEKAHDEYLNLLEEKKPTVQDNADADADPNNVVTEEDVEALMEAQEAWIDELATRYQNLEINFDKKMKTFQTADVPVINGPLAAPPVQHNVINNVTSKPSIQLERIKLNPFDGNIRKYPNFKTSFETHVKPLCTDQQLAFVLRSYLCDSVRNDVDSLGDNVNDIWERLDRTFGDQSRLIDIILSDVKSIESCNDDNSTLQMIKTVERCYYDLKSMKREQEMNNTTIISMIEGKMPSEMSNEWIKLITKSNAHTEKFKLLQNHLEDWRKRIEYKIANIRTNHDTQGFSNYVSSNAALNRNRHNPNRAQKCWIHVTNGDHPIWKCRVFLGKTVAERIELTKQNKACFCCLEVDHLTENCTRNFRCTENNCKERHNKLLHTEISLPTYKNHNASSSGHPQHQLQTPYQPSSYSAFNSNQLPNNTQLPSM